MKSEPTVLLIDDEPSILSVLERRLKKGGYRPYMAQTADAALVLVSVHQPDVVLCDQNLGDMDGFHLMEKIHAVDSALPVLILTGHGSIPNAVEAMKRGAAGYLTKPVDREELFAQLERCVSQRRLAAELSALRRVVDEKGELEGIIGASPSMRRVYELIEKLAPTGLTVSIHGESGTGKELVARALHNLSPRANRTFMAINCAALNEQLLQSELFGHCRGAFTGAHSDREGLFQKADGGTLFLDEIGDMTPTLQVALLRALQEREVLPVGGRKPVQVNARVVVATHRSLDKLVEEGRFREDLFYRVNVAPIHLPPLRDRGDDALTLSQHFLELFADELGRPDLQFASAAMDALSQHHWPGNVRELQHAVHRAAVMTTEDEISVEDLFIQPVKTPSEQSAENLLPFKEARFEWELQYLTRLLKSVNGNVSAAARVAGRYRADMYTLIRKHGLDPTDFK